MDASPLARRLEEARRRLRQAGLRATTPRTLVYELLRHVGGHRAVDEIAARLERSGNRVPRMTVYNVIADLQRVGLVLCADTGPGRALYEAADEWHHHFVCRVCAAVFDVPCLTGSKPCLDPPASLPGTVDEAQVIFRGLCDACARTDRIEPRALAQNPQPAKGDNQK